MARSLLPLNLSWFYLATTFSVAMAEDGDDYFGPRATKSEDVADNIVSVASGYDQPMRSAPAVTTVVTAQQIKDIGARDLYDVLRTVPGFFLGKNTFQVEPVISVRGFKSSFNQNVLVLLDGIPQTDRVTGDRLAVLGNVPLDIIERVEIMRGPGSALYGADAYSAVVDVITRRIPPDKTRVTVGGGSWQTRDARVLGGGRDERQ
jgi:iron complex outermembrane receptor protein